MRYGVVVAAVAGTLAVASPRAGALPRSFAAGEVREIAVSGSAGVPDEGVAAVVVNLTATNVTAATYVTAWPSGATRPGTSNLNPRPGADTANLAVVPLDDTGAMSVYNHAGRADIVVDVLGWIPSDAGYTAAGRRLVDTRTPARPLAAGGRVTVDVPGAAGATALLNVTGVGATTPTFLTVWEGGPPPSTSNVNLIDSVATANVVVTAVATDGTVTVANHTGSIDVVVDLLGTFGAASGVRPLTPTRLLDTRTTGAPASSSRVPVVSSSALTTLTGATADGTLLANLTGVDATARAVVTAWAGSGVRPPTSNLNLPIGGALANLVVLPVRAGDDVRLYVSAGQANLVLDTAAWLPSSGALRTVTPARLYDSRTADASGTLAPPTRNVTYTVGTRGVITADVNAFAASAQATLDDARGWRAAGISFRRVASGGNFTLWLSQAESVPSFGPPCTVNYSCRVGRDVIVNESRWRLATPVWLGAGASLADYQRLVVNHEVGHWLGFDHALCTGTGQPAPVMQQQSKGLNGCLPNAWPTARELAVLG